MTTTVLNIHPVVLKRVVTRETAEQRTLQLLLKRKKVVMALTSQPVVHLLFFVLTVSSETGFGTCKEYLQVLQKM